jgi:Sulfotransferase domain
VEAETRARKNRLLRRLRQQLEAKDRELERLRAQPGGYGIDVETGGIEPGNIVWIFGTGRTGSTWLSAMMGEMPGQAVWFEPRIGSVLALGHPQRSRGRDYIFAQRYKAVWLKNVRALILDGANARYPDELEVMVIKEPGGSVAASLLLEALPESRMVLLVRDPRDVVASWLAASKEGGWRSLRGKASPRSSEELARSFAKSVGGAKRAYESHNGPKVLVRYEELRADTLGTMKRIYSKLDVPVDEGELARVVEKHSWENVPEEEKGEGKFYRKATPGGWREDLTEEQARVVEEITAPLLEEYYGRTP